MLKAKQVELVSENVLMYNIRTSSNASHGKNLCILTGGWGGPQYEGHHGAATNFGSPRSKTKMSLLSNPKSVSHMREINVRNGGAREIVYQVGHVTCTWLTLGEPPGVIPEQFQK